MTTPTPRTDALFMPSVHDGAPTKKLSHGELQVEFAKIECDLAAAQSQIEMLRTGDTCARHCEGTAYRIEARRLATDLAAAQEARERAEGQVERLLLDSEAAHAAITALRDDRTRLQQALYFWLPSIASEETPAGERAAKDSRLLISPDLKDEPSAYELGWIVMDSEVKLLREEAQAAEARADSYKGALVEIADAWDNGLTDDSIIASRRVTDAFNKARAAISGEPS